MLKSKIFAGLLMVCMGTSPVLAQSAGDFDHRFTRGEGRATMGIMVPFGGGRAERAPQLELRMARDMVDAGGGRLSHFGRPATSRVSLTLDGEQRWLVNGRAIRATDRQGISTLGGIAIGAGIALVIGGVLLADAARDASD